MLDFFTLTPTMLFTFFMIFFVIIGFAMLVILWPVLVWPVRLTIRTQTEGGRRLKKDFAKFIQDKHRGRCLQFLKQKDPVTGKKLIWNNYKDEHFIHSGTFLPKLNLTLVEHADGTLHPVSYDATTSTEISDLRDVWPIISTEVDEIIETTKDPSLWVQNKGMIALILVGVLMIGLIAVGTSMYLKTADRRASQLIQLAEDPGEFCKNWQSPVRVEGTQTPLKPVETPEPTEGIKKLIGEDLVKTND